MKGKDASLTIIYALKASRRVVWKGRRGERNIQVRKRLTSKRNQDEEVNEERDR